MLGLELALLEADEPPLEEEDELSLDPEALLLEPLSELLLPEELASDLEPLLPALPPDFP